MTWHWSAAVGFALASCGGAGRAVPTEVEIDWPDAAAHAPSTQLPAAGEIADAGTGSPEDVQVQAMDAADSPSE